MNRDVRRVTLGAIDEHAGVAFEQTEGTLAGPIERANVTLAAGIDEPVIKILLRRACILGIHHRQALDENRDRIVAQLIRVVPGVKLPSLLH